MPQQPKTLEDWPYNQLPSIPMRRLVFQLLGHVPTARQLFEDGEAGDAMRVLNEATHVQLNQRVGVQKDYFAFMVLEALASSDVNTYQSM